MRDLTRITGLPRETIHFYLMQGLLPKPLKTGRNTAVYGDEHVERLQRIKDLQERHFLPLRAIKAVLEEGESGDFSEQQQAVLQRVRASLLVSAPSAAGSMPVAALVPSRVTKRDFEEIKSLGLVSVTGRGTSAAVSAEGADILECWADIRALELPGDPPLTPDVLLIYEQAMESLVNREARTLIERYASQPADRLAELVEETGPTIMRLLSILRGRRIRLLLEGAETVPPPGT